MNAPPTLADVAAAAGVSPATASRVINDSPRVAPDTRQRVVDVINRVGYSRRRARWTFTPPPEAVAHLVLRTGSIALDIRRAEPLTIDAAAVEARRRNATGARNGLTSDWAVYALVPTRSER